MPASRRPARLLPPPRMAAASATVVGLLVFSVAALGWFATLIIASMAVAVNIASTRFAVLGAAAPDPWQSDAALLADRLGVGAPRVVVATGSDDDPSKVATAKGSRRRPVIVVAVQSLDVPDDVRAAILAHELSHVAGADHWFAVAAIPGVIAALQSGRQLAVLVVPSGGVVADAVGLGLSVAAGAASIVAFMFVARQTEWRADLRAVGLTGDPVALASVLGPVSDGAEVSSLVRVLSSHPLPCDRQQSLLRLS